MDKQKILDIDHLRSYEVDPAYFGLGFIQLKITPNSRLHFYHNDLPVLADDPHDHRYDFVSHILQGTFTQTIWQFNASPNGTHLCVNESCKPGVSGGTFQLRGNLEKLITSTHNKGSFYHIAADVLHTVSAQDNAITLLNRTTPHKDVAKVVRPVHEEAICPFSEPIAVDECWDMINEMITNKPGYHIDNIKKGVVGEPSKLIEEALELQDAQNQGVKIMQQVELSDMYGAMVRYMEKYHPDLTMDDIKQMHEVTRRAFDNGHR